VRSHRIRNTNKKKLMAVFEIVEGAPGQGKSLYTARLVRQLLKRNKRWAAQGHETRMICSNIKFAEAFEEESRGFLHYWSDPDELTQFRDVDIIWDEIATELDSRNWVNLSVEMKRFLSQYRKRGVDIYANTQDFSMIDARARLMITRVRTLTKLIGSRDISTTKPPPKYIWGLVMIRDVQNFRETDPEKKRFELVPSFMVIERESCEIYDTRQDITMGKPAPLKHTVVYCEHYDAADPAHRCSFKQVRHT